jgi:hypothetical protein
MPTINKPLLKLALALHTQLASNGANDPFIELPVSSWDRCAELVRQLRRARLRGWHLAMNQLLGDLSYAIPSVQHELAAIQERLPRSTGIQCLATVSDIYQDLVSLSEEFEEFDADGRTQRLSVTTEAITLDNVYLGPFKIQLQSLRLSRGEGPAYRIIAKDPHPAESRENVTHPHVMDEILCEGDGRAAIRQALAQGRLLDFFTLIAGILRTYNQESPFVELALWHGSTCSDCGTLVDEDDGYSCQKCGDTICGDCEATCCGCDDCCCANCIGSCAACEDNHCDSCLKTCDGCLRRVCSGCLDQNERCPNCHEKDCFEDRTDDCAPPPDGAAVQPHRLGQAFVPA